MIAILADDFSGAAELAGIAAARGFKAEVQTAFDPGGGAEVIAVDADTRWRHETEAAQITAAITAQILAAKPRWIYKKTDSVMRGHLRAEIEAILDVTALKECVLIPANPSKGRVIREGRYFIGGVPLHETFFAQDPDHPRRSSKVRELLGESSRILLPDAASLADLPARLPPATLAAGAADFFGVLLGSSPTPGVLPHGEAGEARRRSLLLCGSLAAWETGRATEMSQRGFMVKTLDEEVAGSVWQGTSRVMLAMGAARRERPAVLTERLIQKALPLLAEPQGLRVGLEGGATALAFIRQMGWKRFEVLAEAWLGVGLLRPPGGPVLCVKPGSYPWPEGCL